MFIGPIALLCGGWFFLCWILVKLLSIILNGALKKTISAAAIVWIVPLFIGVVATAKGV